MQLGTPTMGLLKTKTQRLIWMLKNVQVNPLNYLNDGNDNKLDSMFLIGLVKMSTIVLVAMLVLKTMVTVGLALLVGPVTSYYPQSLSQHMLRTMSPISDRMMM